MSTSNGLSFEERLHTAILASYKVDDLDQMVQFRLNHRLDLITPNPKERQFTAVVFELIQWAIRFKRLPELTRAAAKYLQDEGGDQTELVALVQELDAPRTHPEVMGSGVPGTNADPQSGLEKADRSYLQFINITPWLERLLRIERQVGRVELDGTPVGTGFLVGPDAVLTCYSVVEPVFREKQPGSTLQVRFDYRVLANSQVQDGVVVPLAPNGVIDWCPYAPAEAAGDWDKEVPTVDELDYVLLRLARRVGEEAVNPIAPDGPRRGWIPIRLSALALVPHMPLLIVQHPLASTLKLALDTDGVIGLNANGTRVRYATNTDSGSAGSPCFDFQLTLIAVHHACYPAYSRPKQWSQGIPIAAIRARLERLGMAHALGGDPA
jgi:hypothetical protein